MIVKLKGKIDNYSESFIDIDVKDIVYRVLLIGYISKSYFAKLFCYGYGSAIFFYVVVNMAMVLGLLPIVGSPLPIMSYGGSSMLATMIGFGIVLSARINHKQLIA